MPDHWQDVLEDAPAYVEFRRTLAERRDKAIDALRLGARMSEAELRHACAALYTLHDLYTRQPAREDPS